MPLYDLLIYHDLADSTASTGDKIPPVGANAEEWFGGEMSSEHKAEFA